MPATRSTADADELVRFRRAPEDTLAQVDWCIGFLHGVGKHTGARTIAQNRVTIGPVLINRASEPVPAVGNS